VIVKYSKNINNEKPINPLIVAEKLQHIYSQSFEIFNELILKPTGIESKSIDKYRSVNFTLKSLEDRPLIYVCVETLSRYTLHCSMRIEGGILNGNDNVYQTPLIFRMKIYLDAQLLEVYDASSQKIKIDKKDTQISPKLLNPISSEVKLIKSDFLYRWLKMLKVSGYAYINNDR
tara:strand:+ start:296 stop:820 length:525 start_codon:yes stop_codon:yes gene_type:complete